MTPSTPVDYATPRTPLKAASEERPIDRVALFWLGLFQIFFSLPFLAGAVLGVYAFVRKGDGFALLLTIVGGATGAGLMGTGVSLLRRRKAT